MCGSFKEIAEALFHLAQVYEFCVTCDSFRTDSLYRDVLLELAGNLADMLRSTLPRAGK